jgi:5-methylcytosine-specific restriction endonuclease McrA
MQLVTEHPDPEFDRLSGEQSREIQKLASTVYAPARRRTEILDSATWVRRSRQTVQLLLYGFWFAAGPSLVTWFLGKRMLAVAIGVLYAAAISGTMIWKKHQSSKALQSCAAELEELEHLAKEAESRIPVVLEEYHERIRVHCDTVPFYPRDWDERRQLVLQRDRHMCTACGWPRGYRRRARDLHVHHIVSLSDGGSNVLSNLITLCHVCHRKVDKKHAGVRKLTSGRRGRRRW